MAITYYPHILQNTPEWLALRCGVLTASEIPRIITPAKLQYAASEKEKTHVMEIAAQRITKYVEPIYQSFDMMRGQEDEAIAKNLYHENYAPITDMGFVTNDKWGYTLGWSPDALVGDDGFLECKSRLQKYQLETIIKDKRPDDFLIQNQAQFLISERQWCDFISFCGGMYMLTLRVYPDEKVMKAIEEVSAGFEARVASVLQEYEDRINQPNARLIMTERPNRDEDIRV